MTTGKRLTAALVLAAAPLLAAAPAHAMVSQPRECFQAPCTSPTVVETTARYVHGFEVDGWACAHLTGRHWECAALKHHH